MAVLLGGEQSMIKNGLDRDQKRFIFRDKKVYYGC